MRARLKHLWTLIWSSYWFLPACMSLLAIGLAEIALWADARIQTADIDAPGWIYDSSAEGARAVLSTIAGSLITVVGVVFSITIVALTLASQQYGPRILQNFMNDTANQFVLGVYSSTFIYCLLTLRGMRAAGGDEPVARASVTLGVALAVLSVAVLIYFFQHIPESIQADRVVSLIAFNLHRAMNDALPSEEEPEEEAPSDEQAPEGARLMSRHAGYIVAIDFHGLAEVCRKCDISVSLRCRIGRFVFKRQPILVTSSEQLDEDAEKRLRRQIVFGPKRSPQSDIEFGFYELVEVAIRSLSPGINDPHTAIAAIDRLGEALREIQRRPAPKRAYRDKEGTTRVVAQPFTFEDLLAVGVDEIRPHLRNSTPVLFRLLEVLAAVAAHAPGGEQREMLSHEADRIAAEALQHISDDDDRRQLEQRVAAVRNPREEG